MKICRLECERLINKLVDKLELTNFYSAIYGSSAIFETNRLSEGDIDLVVVSADLQRGGFEPIIRESIGDYHIYLISDEIFRDDIKTLAYGGYYCHKFALSFKPLIKRGSFVDAPKEYWTYELCRLGYKPGSKICFEDIIRMVHRDILVARPTFLRSLGKYLHSFERKHSLIRFVQDLIQDVSPFAPLKEVEMEVYKSGVECAFFRFWRECQRLHLDAKGTTNKSVFAQMSMSMDCADYQYILDYIENKPQNTLINAGLSIRANAEPGGSLDAKNACGLTGMFLGGASDLDR